MILEYLCKINLIFVILVCFFVIKLVIIKVVFVCKFVVFIGVLDN